MIFGTLAIINRSHIVFEREEFKANFCRSEVHGKTRTNRTGRGDSTVGSYPAVGITSTVSSPRSLAGLMKSISSRFLLVVQSTFWIW